MPHIRTVRGRGYMLESGVSPLGPEHKASQCRLVGQGECGSRSDSLCATVYRLPQGPARRTLETALAVIIAHGRLPTGNLLCVVVSFLGLGLPVVRKRAKRGLCPWCALAPSVCDRSMAGRPAAIVSVRGERRTIAEWCAHLGVTRQALWKSSEQRPELSAATRIALDIERRLLARVR